MCVCHEVWRTCIVSHDRHGNAELQAESSPDSQTTTGQLTSGAPLFTSGFAWARCPIGTASSKGAGSPLSKLAIVFASGKLGAAVVHNMGQRAVRAEGRMNGGKIKSLQLA
mmetsp:Transcript_39526/g.73691  ORF Transcript_39526/g.73691 Transcript_39526/m.73691 type:complete len:111 (+) Transcript_39526:115-447(+)